MANLTSILWTIHESVDGFVGIRIISLTEGSVVCNYIVILAKNSTADKITLKEVVVKADEEGKFGYRVNSVNVDGEEPTEQQPEEELPSWALVTMIVLGCLLFVFLVAVIVICVSIKLKLRYYLVSYFVTSLGIVHRFRE